MADSQKKETKAEARARKRAERAARRKAKAARKAGITLPVDEVTADASVESLRGNAGAMTAEQRRVAAVRAVTGTLSSHETERDVKFDSFSMTVGGNHLITDCRLELNQVRGGGTRVWAWVSVRVCVCAWVCACATGPSGAAGDGPPATRAHVRLTGGCSV